MSHNRELLLTMFNVTSFVSDELVEDLDRLEQLDRLVEWYEGYNPLPRLIELAEYQLKQRVEAAALAQFTDSEFAAFRLHWQQLSAQEQRNFLCDLAGLTKPHRDRE